MISLDVIRRGVGATLVLAAAAWPIASATGHLRITDDKLNPSDKGPRVIHITRAPEPTDLAPALLIGLVLWLPDAATIAVPGLSVTRRLEQAEEHLGRIENAVHAQQQMAVTMVLGDERLSTIMREKAPLLHESGPLPEARSLSERLQQLYAHAATYEASGPQEAAAVLRWRTVFTDELRIVQTAAEATGTDLGHSVSSAALSTLATLERYLDESVTEARRPTSHLGLA